MSHQRFCIDTCRGIALLLSSSRSSDSITRDTDVMQISWRSKPHRYRCQMHRSRSGNDTSQSARCRCQRLSFSRGASRPGRYSSWGCSGSVRRYGIVLHSSRISIMYYKCYHDYLSHPWHHRKPLNYFKRLILRPTPRGCCSVFT